MGRAQKLGRAMATRRASAPGAGRSGRVESGRGDDPEAVRARPRVARGTLRRVDILDAALALVAREPHRPLTMERVAAELGTRPMSLYTHVRNRDDLIEGAFEHVLSRWRPGALAGPWDDAIRAWCEALRAVTLPYAPLLLDLSRPGRLHPGLIARVAELSALLRRAGLSGAEHARAVRWIPQAILGAILLEAERPRHLKHVADESAAIAGALAGVSTEHRMELVSLLPFLEGLGNDDLFAYTVERMLDGLRAVLVASRGASNEHEQRRSP